MEKSPCVTCEKKNELPICANECSLLHRLQKYVQRGADCSVRTNKDMIVRPRLFEWNNSNYVEPDQPIIF